MYSEPLPGETLLEEVLVDRESDDTGIQSNTTFGFAHDFLSTYLQGLPGAVLLFDGGIGAGKTTFCRAIGDWLQVSEQVNSPTFNLLHIHHGQRGVLCHYDLYRISEAELDELEFTDLWKSQVDHRFTIHAIEWWRHAGRVVTDLPVFRLAFDYGTDDDQRIIRIFRRIL